MTVMVALPLFDAVLSERQPERSAKVAAELIRSALGEIRHIENLDESLAPGDPSQFDRQTVALLRGMYEEWARQAEALLDRVAPLERAGPIAGAEALRDAQGRTWAMLSIPLDRLERSHKDAVEGRTIPVEEVRRELRHNLLHEILGTLGIGQPRASNSDGTVKGRVGN